MTKLSCTLVNITDSKISKIKNFNKRVKVDKESLKENQNYQFNFNKNLAESTNKRRMLSKEG